MKRTGWTVMLRLIRLIWPLAGYMLLAVLLGLAGHLCAAWIAPLGGFALLRVLDAGPEADLRAPFAAMALCALARGPLRYGEQACNHFIAFKLLALIRDKVFGALRRLCPAKLEGRDRGDLIHLITSDTELLELFYAHTVSPVCIAVLFSAGMAASIGSYHVGLGIFAAAAFLTVGAVIPLVTSRCGGDAAADFRTRSGEMAAFVLEFLRGLFEILQYGRGAERLERLQAQTKALSGVEAQIKRTAGYNQAATHAAILAFDLGMLLLASQLCDAPGALICTLMMMSAFGPCSALAALGSTLQNTLAAAGRVLDILEQEPVTPEISGREPVSFCGAGAEDVTFSYGADAVLQDVSLTVPEKEIVGIAGPSGSGKSTLLRLLMRFWRVSRGAVTVSGRNVEDVNTADLRDMESFMTQETYLFHDSIRSNLKIARLDADEQAMIDACQKAAVHDLIMSLPQGYDTPVGELGSALSGGERQRIGLARAFLHQAPFLLLDEPTANLDSLNEAAILRALHRAKAERTVVLVSHRASALGIADKTCRIEGGRMCEWISK